MMNNNKKPTRLEQAFTIASTLVEDIRLLTRALPEEEDMGLVPMMREKVMFMHKSVMMLAHGELVRQDVLAYTDDVYRSLAGLGTYVHLCRGLEYIDQDTQNALDAKCAEIESLLEPKAPTLTLVQ